MKKLIVALALLSALNCQPIFAAPPAAPLCGRVVRRIAPATPRGLYRYDVVVGSKILRWSAPTKYGIGARICV